MRGVGRENTKRDGRREVIPGSMHVLRPLQLADHTQTCIDEPSHNTSTKPSGSLALFSISLSHFLSACVCVHVCVFIPVGHACDGSSWGTDGHSHVTVVCGAYMHTTSECEIFAHTLKLATCVKMFRVLPSDSLCQVCTLLLFSPPPSHLC